MRPVSRFPVLLAVLPAALLATLAPLAVPGPAAAAPLSKANLLKLREAESVYPQLRGRHDDGARNVYTFGIDAPAFATSPLDCARFRNYRGTSRIEGAYYSVSGPSFDLTEDLVTMRTPAEAHGVLGHYRSYIKACTGSHATSDGEGGTATMKVRGWHPRRVGDERVGMVDAFIQYGEDNWRRTLVTRVGRTVLVLVVTPRHGTGSASRIVDAADLALTRLG